MGLRYVFFFSCLISSFAQSSEPVITHGVTVGEVTHEQAVLWARSNRPGFLHIQVGSFPPQTTELTANADYTGKIAVLGLKSNKRYRFKAWLGQQENSKRPRTTQRGKFRTAPKPRHSKSLTFIWSGDLAGQNVCRDQAQGYPIFDVMNKDEYDFFIGLGDMIYADSLCEEVGAHGNRQIPGEFPIAQTLEDFWAHWRYNFGDPGVRRVMSKAPYFAIWDDHEIINDFGPSTARRDGEDILNVGLRAFLDYNPVLEQNEKIYRSIRWGKNLEIFFLDTRQYRDPNIETDTGKTLLGHEQKHWLVDSVTTSNATWKLVVSSVPISVPTGFPATNGRDGWANFDQDTGFETELTQILRQFQKANTKNLFWITTDVHFAAVYQYAALADKGDPLIFHEAMVGPLSAGVYPTRDLDDTFNPNRLFFYGPEKPIESYEASKQWMNYGRIEIERDGRLKLSVVNGLGEVVYELGLTPR